MDKNETKYELTLDARDFISQLQQIKNALDGIGKIVKQQSGETYAIDVQIKNKNVERFFERLDNSMGRAEKAGEDFSTKLENEVGKAFEKSIGKAVAAIHKYEDALKTSTQKIADTASKTSQNITDVYEKQDAQTVKFLNRTERKAKESAQKIFGEYNKTFREMKKDLEQLGADTSNMSARDIEKFWANANKIFNKRETSKALVKGVMDTVEKTSVAAFDKIGAVAEKNADKQGRMLEATSSERVKQEELAQAKIDKLREAAAEKERQRALRQRLYRQNVAEASRMLAAQVAQESSPEEQKLLSRYNRSVARIRGIYQSAVIHGRVENPETILAGLTELQQRSLALNNFRLSSQIGINKINDELKTTVRRMEEIGTRWNKVSSVIQNSVQAFATIQSAASKITSIITQFTTNVLSRLTSQVHTLVDESTAAFKSLEVSMIGFRNFFGEEYTDRLYQRIKTVAAQAPGLATTDLAEYVRQIAPVSGHNAELALNASLGMLKTIQYGGASGSTEMEYVIKNIRDVITKGKATAIDVRQFNRAMPILEEVLSSVGQSQLLKDGVLTIDKDNVDTILTAFAELNTSNQSAVKDIFDQMNHTLSGQWEQFREQFTTNLMEAFRGAGVYGLAQNVMMQINNGAYVQDSLARLRNSLAEFVNGINWFKVQRIAGEVWDGLKIIWEGFEDAVENIEKAVGTFQTKSAIQSFSEWIADIIRGMGDGIAQVIRFIKHLESSGIMNLLSRAIGWFGSIGAGVTKLMATLASHITNISGNMMQLIARYKKLNLNRQLESRQAQLDAIPLQYRSQVASVRDLLNGGKSPAVTPEAQAINNLTSTVTKHLTKIESNQAESQQIAKQSLQTSAATKYRIIGGRVYPDTMGQKTRWTPDYYSYPKANELFGGARQITSELAGGRVIATTRNVDEGGHAKLLVYNPRTGKYDEQTYDNTLKAYQAQRATAARLNGANILQRSDNELLRKIGNNKAVTSTIKTFEKAGKAIKGFVTNLTTGLMQGGATLAITETITTMIESLDTFGDATTYIAGIIKAAGLTIAGAMMGNALGIPGGGITGALVGLGLGIINLVSTIKEKEKELANIKITDAMDDAEKAMYDQTVELLREYGFNVDKESIVGAGALQQLAYYIKSTPVANRSTEEAVRYYNEAYKMLSVGYGLKNFAESSEYGTMGGTQIDLSDTAGELFKQLAKMVRDYGLAETNGYYYGYGINGRSYYRDEALTEEISAEELLKNAFPDGVTDKQARSLLEKANTLNDDYGKSTVEKLDNLLKDNTDFKSALENIDKNVADILRNVVDFLGKATPENLGDWYGEPAKNQAEGFAAHANGWERFLALMGVDSAEYANEGYGGERGMDKVYYPNVRNKLGLEFENATKEGDEERAGYLGEWINQVDNYEFGGYSGWLKDWISFILEKLTDYNNTFGRNFRFARGGLVPAFSAVGVDTIPAMLSPGEFVMKPSVVKKAGLGVMHALNRGDLGAAARSLAQNVSNRTWNRNSSSIFHNKITNNNTNSFKIINKNASARMNSYRSLANSFRF